MTVLRDGLQAVLPPSVVPSSNFELIMFGALQEIYRAIRSVHWTPEKPIAVSITSKQVFWQEAYNRLFGIEFGKVGGWTANPIPCDKPRHKGDFAKNDVFVEIQCGNSATLYRDYSQVSLRPPE